MQFANPIGLWALAGLLIPVAIHLLSRAEGRTIPFGGLRNLTESPTARFRRVRPNELALLVLRCLLITLFACLLAQLHFDIRNKKKWVLVEEHAYADEATRTAIDDLVNADFEPHLLAPGFPLLSDGADLSSEASYWRLVEELSAEPLDSAVVFSFNYLRKFRGLRTALPAHVHWVTLQPTDQEFVASRSQAGDSTWIRSATTSSVLTHYDTRRELGTARPSSEISIDLFTSPSFEQDEKIIVAALSAVQTITTHKLRVRTLPANATATPDNADWVFWLSDEPMPTTNGPTAIVYEKQDNMDELLIPNSGTVSGNEGGWIITQRLNEAVALENQLALDLATLIIPSEVDTIVDNRVLADTALWTESQTKRATSLTTSAEPYLLLLMIITLFVERWVAYTRQQ